MHLDIAVSSSGDARSLEGGFCLLNPMYAADGQVYACPRPLGGGGSARDQPPFEAGESSYVGVFPRSAVERDSASI